MVNTMILARLTHAPLPSRRKEHLSHPRKRAPNRSLLTISPTSHQKNHKRNRHHCCRHAIPDSPSDVVLHIDHHQYRGGGTEHYPQVPPIEERALGRLLLGKIFVKLVCSECLDAWLVATFPNAQYVEGYEENCLGMLQWCGGDWYSQQNKALQNSETHDHDQEKLSVLFSFLDSFPLCNLSKLEAKSKQPTKRWYKAQKLTLWNIIICADHFSLKPVSYLISLFEALFGGWYYLKFTTMSPAVVVFSFDSPASTRR